MCYYFWWCYKISSLSAQQGKMELPSRIHNTFSAEVRQKLSPSSLNVSEQARCHGSSWWVLASLPSNAHKSTYDSHTMQTFVIFQWILVLYWGTEREDFSNHIANTFTLLRHWDVVLQLWKHRWKGPKKKLCSERTTNTSIKDHPIFFNKRN